MQVPDTHRISREYMDIINHNIGVFWDNTPEHIANLKKENNNVESQRESSIQRTK